MADQRTEGTRVSQGVVCSVCWIGESLSRTYRCIECRKICCETCGMEGHLKCTFCGYRLKQFRGDIPDGAKSHTAENGMVGSGSMEPEAMPTWPGLPSRLAQLHRQAFTKVSFGAFVSVGIGIAICSQLTRITSRDGAKVLLLASLLLSLYQAYLFWHVFARRNWHFKWHRRLEFALLKLVHERGGRIAALTRLTMDARQREFKCSTAVFFANVMLGWLGTIFFVLGAIGQVMWRWNDEQTIFCWVISGLLWTISVLFGLYIAKRLTQDFYYHEQREDHFLRTVTEETQALNIEFSAPGRVRPLKKRHFWLYLFVYTPLTLGLFGIYWMHVIFNDPHRHFAHQHSWEAHLLPLVSYLAVPETMPTDADISALVTSGPEPVAVSVEDHLQQLSSLLNKGVISEAEYEARRQVWIEKL